MIIKDFMRNQKFGFFTKFSFLKYFVCPGLKTNNQSQHTWVASFWEKNLVYFRSLILCTITIIFCK